MSSNSEWIKLDISPTAQHGGGFFAGSIQLRWFYAGELLDNTLLNYPLVVTAQAKFADLYECSERYDTEWCRFVSRLGILLDFD